MASPEDIVKVKNFVDHLLSLPNIKNEPPLISEGLILNFVVQNLDHLKKSFKTPQFFPNLEWNEVLQIVLSELFERVASNVLPSLNEFVEETDFEAISKVAGDQSFPPEFKKEKTRNFIANLFRNKDARYNFHSVINLLQYGIIDKYIGEIFRRRDYLYNELVRVQKSYLEADEYIVFLKVLLLIKNAAYMKIPSGDSENSPKLNLFDSIKNPGKFQKFVDHFTRQLRRELPHLSEKIITLALKSNLRENLTETEEASSRFLYILTTRYHEYKPMEKVDRGAESPDKSWFAVARKNAEYYGFDKRMLEELYRIAGDNNW